jgi:hypothetical protein
MLPYVRREKPANWTNWRAHFPHSWALPFLLFDYSMDWCCYFLSNWRFLEALEYLGNFGVLIAVIFYFAESGDRIKQKHYQAWQVINSAEGKGGNGGRIDALHELNRDGVSLIGVNLASAFLMGVRLPKAKLARANFDSVDARDADLEGAMVTDASLRSANFRGANLKGASFAGSTLDDADLSGADLRKTDLSGTSFEKADLRNVDLRDANWTSLQSVKGTNVLGVNNPAFVAWALAHGAVAKPEQ